MKKDRNCSSTPYPIYQMQPPIAPMMPNTMYQGSIPVSMMQSTIPMMQNTIPMNQSNYQTTSIEQQLNNLSNQVNNLERRVTSLEGLIGSNYNTSNFQMM